MPTASLKCIHDAALFIYGNYNLRRTDVVCSWKKGMHPIFLRNLSLKCFLQRNKGGIYSLTPTTKSRRSRTARSAAFMQNSERIESLLARIVSLICSQRTDLIYNFPILNFHLINSSCSAAVDRLRNSSGKLFLPLLRQEDPPVVLVQGLTANVGRLTAIDFGSSFNANRVTPSLIERLLGEYDISHVKAVAWESK